MRNKNLFETKMNRLDGKLQTIKVMVTRNTSINDIHNIVDEAEELLEDMRNMLDRE